MNKEIPEEIWNLMMEAFKDDPMKVVIVDSKDDIPSIVEKHKREGRRVAAVSNAGLSNGKMRITFLPESAFTDYKKGENE